MKLLTIELISNASAQISPYKTLSYFTTFLPKQLNLEGLWEVAISKIFHPSVYQNVREVKLKFFDKKRSNLSQLNYLQPNLYPSITDIVEAMNTLIQERQNHSESCITVKKSRRTQKVEIYLANEGSDLAFASTDLAHFFSSTVGNEIVQMLRGGRPHKPEFADDIVRKQFHMMLTDLIEYNIVRHTKAPLLHCFF